MDSIKVFIDSLKLGDKLSPFRNRNIAWFYLFLPSLVLYLSVLMGMINKKPVVGSVEIFDASYGASFLYNGKAKIEVISTGMNKTDGPLWVEEGEDSGLGYLVYSDMIQNRIFKWEEGKGFFTVGKTVLLKEAGCHSDSALCGTLQEPGAAGLLRHPPPEFSPYTLELIACQHGERSISYIRENGVQQPLITHFRSRRLNSPNDLVKSPEGHIFFTDPALGLALNNGTMTKAQLPFQGVYLVRSEDILLSIQEGRPVPGNETILVIKNIEAPNGLAFSPDYTKLYVSNCDKTNPYWRVYEVRDDGTGRLKDSEGEVFFNASSLPNSNGGCPDGLKVDIHGNVYASGPGGVLIISPEGKLLARLNLEQAVTNLAFGTDGKLYLTAGGFVARMSVRTRGARFVPALKKK
jgi:gluconolactonase